jgi:hypothetical protein
MQAGDYTVTGGYWFAGQRPESGESELYIPMIMR